MITEQEKLLYINTRQEPYVVVDLETGTILSNPKQVVIVAADLIADLQSDREIIREACKHGYALNEVDWT